MEKLAENFEHTIEFFGFLASFFTLIMAYLVYRKVGSNHIKTKQIDHVCDLIANLNEANIQFQFMHNSGEGSFGGSSYSLRYNIFEIGYYDTFEKGNDDLFSNKKLNHQYEVAPVLFDKKSNQIIKVREYIDHPLTPRPIADELTNFYNSRCKNITQEEVDRDIKDFVIIKTDIFEEHVSFSSNDQECQFGQGQACAFYSWKNLKEHSKKLKIEITDWLIEQGIKENNIREDFKNPA